MLPGVDLDELGSERRESVCAVTSSWLCFVAYQRTAWTELFFVRGRVECPLDSGTRRWGCAEPTDCKGSLCIATPMHRSQLGIVGVVQNGWTHWQDGRRRDRRPNFYT